MKTAAIVNPKSASGKTAREWTSIGPALPGVETRFTDAPGHATAIAQDLLHSGFERIVAVGGDGTINEVANGFFARGQAINPAASLAIVPLGTGGDLRRSLGIRNVGAAIDLIRSNRAALPTDVGRITYHTLKGEVHSRYFLNVVSFGMGGAVAAGAKNWFSRFGGKAGFFFSTIRTFFTYHPVDVEVKVDGERAGTFAITNVAVGNGRYHGGGMHVCPRAKLDDGLLEVTIIRSLSAFELARDIRILYSDNIYAHPKVRHVRGTRIVANAFGTASIEVDGEPLGRLPIEIEVVPKAMRVLRWP